MKARSSSGVVLWCPTSPISAPTEIVTPAGSRSRTSRVKCAVSSAFSRCCSTTVGSDRSTTVEASMSMLKKLAAICVRMTSVRRCDLGLAGP